MMFRTNVYLNLEEGMTINLQLQLDYNFEIKINLPQFH